ncbi:hypothetical protein D6C77_10330 [Aureobasidium pullulans]|nr:hypothetical protein D6C77_10330 [Aureobasidium pullulans]
MTDSINPARQKIHMNALQQGSAPPPIDAQRTSEQQKQSAKEAIQATRLLRNSADREVASQHNPPLPRSRSHSRVDCARVPRTNLNALNELEGENAPLQPSANTFQSAMSSHTLQDATQEQNLNPRIRFDLGNRPPGAFVDSSFVQPSFVNENHAPTFDDDTQSQSQFHQDHDYDNDFIEHGNLIDDTLLDVTKDFELNINEIVTNALRRKSNSPIDTLEQFSALDAEDFAARAEEAIDDLSDDVRALEDDATKEKAELSSLRETNQRRETKLGQCRKIITQQQDTLAIQQDNIAELQNKIAYLERNHNTDRGRDPTRSLSRPRSPSRHRSWSPSQINTTRQPVIPRVSKAPSGQTHATRATTVSSAASRPLRVPDPPEFDNKSSVSFSQWKVKMRIKLFSSGDYEDRSEDAKLDYVLSRTGGSVFERLLMRMPDSPNPSLRFNTAQECLDQLNDWYGDRHRQARAYTEFESLA